MSKWNILDKFIASLRYGKVKKFIPKNTILMDIGCGQEAQFLKNMQNQQSLCIGIDKYIENYQESNLQLKNMDLSKEEFPKEEKVDVVTMLAVIEHLEKPEELLLNINKVLNKDGLFILTTPAKIAEPILNFMAFKLKIINADEIREHKHYYNKKELDEILAKQGFALVKYSYFMFGVNQLCVAKKI